MQTLYLVISLREGWSPEFPDLNILVLHGAYTSVVRAADCFGFVVDCHKKDPDIAPHGVAILSFDSEKPVHFKVLNKYIPSDERKEPSLFD